MFIRKKTFYRRDGTKREYLQIVKTCREKGKVHQKVICNLGRLEDLKKRSIDTLIQGLSKFSEKLTVIDTGKDLLARDAKEYHLNAIINSIGNAGENSRVKKIQKE